MGYKVTDSVSWVGKIDWELRKFHGEEYTTKRGSSYNAFLIRDQKIALIDTVWGPFAKEFVDNLRREVDLRQIDYIVANHGETDHSGALPELMKEIPDTPIYCTANGVKSLKGQYHQDWNFQVVKTGDKLNLGSKELLFIEAPMLHWPDTMFTYLNGENMLFTSDAFGQHYASELMFNDQVDQAELYEEAVKYYANIITPFSRIVDKKIKEILAMNLPIAMICPDHGVLWRSDPQQIVQHYLAWAGDYQENQITIIYDTMWNSTRAMAEAVANGIRSVDDTVVVKLYNCARHDNTTTIAEVFKSKAIAVGSPTVNRRILSAVAGILEEFKGLSFKNKHAAAFGSYGWSGEGVKIIQEQLASAGFMTLGDGVRELWYPDDAGMEHCHALGRELALSHK